MITAKPKRAERIVKEGGLAEWSTDRFFDELEESINKYVHASNYTAVVAPAITNDSSEGYTVGSEWLDTTGPTWYKCSDNTEGAAVWSALN